MILGTSKMNKDGKITLPAALRRKLGVASGDSIAFVPQDGSYVLEKV
jgi:AbrB family looped-hinge helix DNA binding protein